MVTKFKKVGMVSFLTIFLILFLASSAVACGIDIKPGSDPNAINLNNQGVVPVAIFGGPPTYDNPEGFDVNWIMQSTILFAGASPVSCHYEDVNGDGYMDLVCHFRTQDLTELNSESTVAYLIYKVYPGSPSPVNWCGRCVTESDYVKIVGSQASPTIKSVKTTPNPQVTESKGQNLPDKKEPARVKHPLKKDS